MASTIGLSPENLLDRSQKYSSYAWFRPRLSLSREIHEEDGFKSKNKRISSVKRHSDLKHIEGPAKEESDTKEFEGFEFVLEDPVTMLPADELFSDGKLIPMQFSVIRQGVTAPTAAVLPGVNPHRIMDDAFAVDDPYLFSPRAPRCSSRWKELLGFGKLNNAKVDHNKRTSLASSHNATGATKSIRQLLYRSSKSSNDLPINLPLLRDADTESVSVSSRPSLSSSSSGHDIDDLPRLSLDSDKSGKLNLNSKPNNRPKSRMVKTRSTTAQPSEARPSTRIGRSSHRRSTTDRDRGLSVDSPRLNSSGKIIFHSLERSSSSPSSFNGGPTIKHRGMERSYSANVRITPVLNVPVCSLRGIFSSQQKREASSSNNGGSNRSQRFNGKSRTDC